MYLLGYIFMLTQESLPRLARVQTGQDTLSIFRLLWTPVHILAFVDSSSCFGFCGLLFQKQEDAEYITDKCILFWVVLCVCGSLFNMGSFHYCIFLNLYLIDFFVLHQRGNLCSVVVASSVNC